MSVHTTHFWNKIPRHAQSQMFGKPNNLKVSRSTNTKGLNRITKLAMVTYA
jgi:hypothetical protein